LHYVGIASGLAATRDRCYDFKSIFAKKMSGEKMVFLPKLNNAKITLNQSYDFDFNASVVIFYNATGSPARFENKNILFYSGKRSSLLQRWRCSCKFKSRRLASGYNASAVVGYSLLQM
jgi:hypothetical protein